MLVCTLPSPACICRAIQTRPLRTRWCIALHSSKMGWNCAPVNTFSRTARICVFQLARRLWSCSCEKSASQLSSHCCQVLRTSANTARACCTRSSNNSGEGTSLASSIAPNGKLPSAKNASNALHKSSLLRKESSMFKRSIPSVYSPMRGRGITTSSLILKALV